MFLSEELQDLTSAPAQANRPHFHIWVKARTGRMFYVLARAFHTRQAARQYANRHRPGVEVMVLQCFERKCAPPLD